MAKKARYPAHDAHKQPYDNVLKRLVTNQPSAILPLLLPEITCQVVETLNIEMLIPPRRADRAYKILSHKGLIVLHLEFETSANGKMDKRALVYHALLLEEYDRPVISVIIYPFEISMVEPPLVVSWDGEELLRFRYKTLPLSKLNAQEYVEQGAVPIYGLLPAMDGTSDELLLEAIEEMVEYYQGKDDLLRDELLCFQTLLARAERLPEAQLERVTRRVRMFDPLLEEDPWVKGKVAEGELRGELKGELRGELKGELKKTRLMLIRFVQKRFPTLVDLASARVMQCDQPEVLDALAEQLWLAADEQAARLLLEARSASS